MAYPPVAPVAWWKFDEGTGTTAGDSSGNGKALTVVSPGVLDTPGRWGAGCFGPQTTGYAHRVSDTTFPACIALDVPWSISGWFYSSTTSGTYQSLLSKINGSNRGFHVSLTPSTYYITLFFCSNISTAYWYGENAVNRRDSTWHHLALTYSGSGDHNDLALYVDNSLQTISWSNLGTPSTIDTSTNFVVGNELTNGYGWKNNVDELMIFDSELSSGSVATLYAGPPSGVLFRRTLFGRAGSRGIVNT